MRLPFAVMFLLTAIGFSYLRYRGEPEVRQPLRPQSETLVPDPTDRLVRDAEEALAEKRLADARTAIASLREAGRSTTSLEASLAQVIEQERARLVAALEQAEADAEPEAMRAALEDLRALGDSTELAEAWARRLTRLQRARERAQKVTLAEAAYRTSRDRGDFFRARRHLETLAGLGEDVAREMRALVRDIDLGGGVTMRFCWIPPGTFTMGSPDDELARGEDETLHEVTLTKGFWLAETELTQAQWAAVSALEVPFAFTGADLPVENVNRAELDELIATMTNKVAGGSFRLPTEAEWEYACRAGSQTAFHFGNRIEATLANFDAREPYGTSEAGTYRRQTVPVRSFPPNRWGLYEMHGNVWEQCLDRYGAYGSEPREDPVIGLSLGRSDFVVRGGGWGDFGATCRSAARFQLDPRLRAGTIGLRLVYQVEE